MENEVKEGSFLLVDGFRGIYVPLAFANYVSAMDAKLMVAKDAFWHSYPDQFVSEMVAAMNILTAGPDHEHYWDAWEEVLDEVTLMYDGKTYRLVQDEDVWAEPADIGLENKVELPWK